MFISWRLVFAACTESMRDPIALWGAASTVNQQQDRARQPQGCCQFESTSKAAQSMLLEPLRYLTYPLPVIPSASSTMLPPITEEPASPSSASTSNSAYRLPQYGFGQHFTFASLLSSNPFLFKVHTPRKPFPLPGQPYFAAGGLQTGSSRSPPRPSYDLAAQYMDWTTRSSSSYVSASFSFAWAIWEASRRWHNGVKHDIEIAVIDARSVESCAVTSLEILREAKPEE